MSFPEPEILNSLVQRIFRIDDVTLGDSQKGWIVRYRGHLLRDDSAAAYDQLADSVRVHGLTPLFRKEGGLQAIFLAPSMPPARKRLPTVNIILFLLTVLSVMLAGAQLKEPLPTDMWGQIWTLVKSISTGWPFALSLLGILLAHEFGHYLMSRHHKTQATLPYFIPLPFSPLGTMGAVIQMQAIPKNKRVLFDIGIAGPLAGMVVAIPVLIFGLSLSHVDVVKDFIYLPDPAGREASCALSQPVILEDGSYTCGDDNFLEGNSLLYLGLKYFRFGQLLPAPENYDAQPPLLHWLKYFFTGSPAPLNGMDVMIDPVAFAGWAGLLVTALNLLPAGTLDGGHITYALFGEKVRKVFPFIIGILVILGFFWNGWWLWAVLLFWLGRVHAAPLDQITELDPRRRALGWFAILLFVLVFSPVPMTLF